MTKLNDVAKKAKVSLATASLALNDSNLISEKTKNRIKKLAEELNYHPSIYAQRLARRKSYNICLMLNSDYFFKSSNLYYLRVIGGIIKEAANSKYSITFAFYGDKNKLNSNFYSTMDTNFISNKNFDGIIVFDVISKEILDDLMQKANIPIVLVDNHLNHPHVYGVDNDDFGGAYKATKYLIELGHKNIGFIGISNTHPLGRECFNGFLKALEDSEMKPALVYDKCKFGIKSGRLAGEEILSTVRNLPSAFFCVNDFVAIGAMEAFKKHGLKIPDDCSFIGMDDMDISSEIEPPLTTVRIEMEKLGQEGLKKLISLIHKNNEQELETINQLKTVIDNKIIVRGSCKSLN